RHRNAILQHVHLRSTAYEEIKGNHNPKVGGSNPSPATKSNQVLRAIKGRFLVVFYGRTELDKNHAFPPFFNSYQKLHSTKLRPPSAIAGAEWTGDGFLFGGRAQT